LLRSTYQKGDVSIFEEVLVVSYERIIGWISAQVDALLGSTDRELILRLAKDSGAGPPWKAEVVVRLCGSMESIETMEDALERTGEMILPLPPQETM
jgi:hypothetical protein